MVTSTTIKRNAVRRPPHHCSAATGNEESSSTVSPLVSFLVLCDVLLLDSVTSNPTTLEPLDESIPQNFFSPGLEFSRGARSLEILSRFAYCTPWGAANNILQDSRFVYSCLVLFLALDPVVLWAPWWHNLWDLRFSSLMNIKSMVPEGLIRDRIFLPLFLFYYTLDVLPSSGFGWWNALGSEQWIRCVVTEMHLPRKHCLTYTLL